MIDNMEQTERLLGRLREALPFPARLTPEAISALRVETGVDGLSAPCAITLVSYAGDEGGIMCHLDLGAATDRVAVVPITHLRFDPRLPLVREITHYQKHRVKRLRRQLR